MRAAVTDPAGGQTERTGGGKAPLAPWLRAWLFIVHSNKNVHTFDVTEVKKNISTDTALEMRHFFEILKTNSNSH